MNKLCSTAMLKILAVKPIQLLFFLAVLFVASCCNCDNKEKMPAVKDSLSALPDTNKFKAVKGKKNDNSNKLNLIYGEMPASYSFPFPLTTMKEFYEEDFCWFLITHERQTDGVYDKLKVKAIRSCDTGKVFLSTDVIDEKILSRNGVEKSTELDVDCVNPMFISKTKLDEIFNKKAPAYKDFDLIPSSYFDPGTKKYYLTYTIYLDGKNTERQLDPTPPKDPHPVAGQKP